MRTPSGSRKRNQKRKAQKPDEVFEAGAFRMARFGKNVVMQADRSPEEFARMQQQAADAFEGIVKEIDETVSHIAELVAELPPLRLLHRAWWESAAAHLFIETEAEVGMDEALSMRMIDYVQSVIASVPRAAEQKEEVSDDDWRTLQQKVERLFRLINLDYQISSTAKRKLEGVDYDEQTEEFRFRAQIYWANVRGQRHYAHQVIALKDLLGNQSDLLETCFGVSEARLLSELEKVWHSLIFGAGEAVAEIEEVRKASVAALEREVAQKTLPSAAMDDPLRFIMDREGLSERASSAGGRFFGLDLFDVGKLTDLPTDLLDLLAWEPGQEAEFFAEGPTKGWPLRIWPTFKRPFLKIEGRYYCFDLHSLFDNAFRVLEKGLFAKCPDLKQKWIEKRKIISESLPAAYFRTILPGANNYGEIYYPNGPTKAEGWSELDGLIAFDDHLFVIEVKSGSFTYTSPTDDFDAHVASLRALLESPAKQARRFLEYLNSADEVPLFDREKKEVARIRRRDFRVITICAVSVDPFTEFAAQARHLSKLGLAGLDQPVWSISVDDLRVFSEVFGTPVEFLHFVEQRMRAFGSDLLQLDDELDHVGLYLAHNNYAQHAEELVSGVETRFNVLGFRSDLDRFYNAKLADPAAISPLAQAMPMRMREVISWLSEHGGSGRARTAAALLDLDGETRKFLFDGMERELERAGQGSPPKVISSFGDVRLTLSASLLPRYPRKHEEAVEFTRALMAAHSEADRLLLEATYRDGGELVAFRSTTVSNTGLAIPSLQKLEDRGQRIRAVRLSAAGTKLGRNDLCPCGSGKKYKKCCLR